MMIHYTHKAQCALLNSVIPNKNITNDEKIECNCSILTTYLCYILSWYMIDTKHSLIELNHCESMDIRSKFPNIEEIISSKPGLGLLHHFPPREAMSYF